MCVCLQFNLFDTRHYKMAYYYYLLSTFDAYLAAHVAVQVAEQNVLPVTAVADEAEVRQWSFWRTNLLLNFA